MNALAEWLVAGLLLGSGVLALLGALGFIRTQDFFQRMHASALVSGLAGICVMAASVVWFWIAEGHPAIYTVLIVVLLAVTMPVTMTILARAALFRKRASGRDVPPSLTTAQIGPLRVAPRDDDDEDEGGHDSMIR